MLHNPESEAKYWQQLRDSVGMGSQTTTRFSLVRRGVADGFVKDLILKSPWQGFRRVLSVEQSRIDFEALKQMEDADVAVLPHIGDTADLAIFGIRQGLKLLSNGALHARESSEVYIGDQEIFTELGKLFGATYRATGSTLLDGTEDNPLEHVAISSFSDNAGYLYLCPPIDRTSMVDRAQARLQFRTALQHALEVDPRIQHRAAEIDTITQPLVFTALTGFNEAS